MQRCTKPLPHRNLDIGKNPTPVAALPITMKGPVMMPTSVRADLTELLGYLGCEAVTPQGDLHVVLFHTIAELARILRDDRHDEDDQRALLDERPAARPAGSLNRVRGER